MPGSSFDEGTIEFHSLFRFPGSLGDGLIFKGGGESLCFCRRFPNQTDDPDSLAIEVSIVLESKNGIILRCSQ